jgi:c-di-GMP-binding flagellar brake protein YcgR
MAKKGEEDRRRFHRFGMKNAVFITFRPEFDMIGKLTDISAGGLAFEYNSFEDREKSDVVEIALFSHPKDYSLPKAVCRVVYDREVEGCFSFKGFQTRRCGLEFYELNLDQMLQLDMLMANGGPTQ